MGAGGKALRRERVQRACSRGEGLWYDGTSNAGLKQERKMAQEHKFGELARELLPREKIEDSGTAGRSQRWSCWRCC